MAPTTGDKARARKALKVLSELYAETQTALDYESPLQLLVAVILSAQCTDVRVNMVTPGLFQRFPDARAFAQADVGEIEELVKSTGFFRNKAKNIQAACRMILDHHQGDVPRTLDELVTLPGVGRKTANVVLGDAFDTPGITVDTHVGRLSRRLGFSEHLDPVKVERDLMALIPQPEWTRFSHRLIFHGRLICKARRPQCGECKLNSLCPKIGVDPR